MAAFKSPKAARYEPIITGRTAGTTISDVTTFTAPTALADGDVIEMTAQPALTKLIGLTLVSTNVTVSVDVGFTTGDFGATDPAKDVGNQFLDDTANGEGVLGSEVALAVERSDQDRGIGIKVNGAVPAGATFTMLTQIAH